jgi:hypothetical protein
LTGKCSRHRWRPKSLIAETDVRRRYLAVLSATIGIAILGLAVVSPHDDTSSVIGPARGCRTLASVTVMVRTNTAPPADCRVISISERVRFVGRLPWQRRIQIDAAGERLWISADDATSLR